MVNETMTSEERILAAIALKPYDRIPVAPLLSPSFPLRHKGYTTEDVYAGKVSGEQAIQAMFDLYDEVGGWDGVLNPGASPTIPNLSSVYYFYRAYNRTMAYPGLDQRLPSGSSPQFAEGELLKPDDYDEIIEIGWKAFMEKNAQRITGSPASVGAGAVERRTARYKASLDTYMKRTKQWQDRGCSVISGFTSVDPQMALTLLRTLPKFTMDLHRYPDKVKKVLDNWVDDFAYSILDAMRPAGIPSTGLPGIALACERGSGSYFRLSIFERFVWPYIKRLVEVWTDAGLVVTLHFDTNWTLNLPYLLQLPKGKAICELDSTTDIFKAKEILKDHMCIMGDVPPQLSALGTTQEMEAYCKRLIDVVGKDTGFILSTGCEQPPDTRFQNYLAMIDTAKNYYPHHG